jgi:4-aminobutyrate aminotransferase
MIQSFHRTEGDINFSPARKEWYSVIRNGETARYLEEDERFFLHQAMSTPCLDVLESCEGIYLRDKQGRSYMDFHGNNVHQLGYRNTFITDRVKAQMDVLPFCPRRYTNEPAVALASRLAGLMPEDLNRVLFAPGGTSAVGMALKLARLVTGRQKVISYWDSFHGASMDAIAVGGEREFRKGLGPLMPGVERIPPPETYRGVLRSTDDLVYADYLEYVIEKEGDVGAFIAETIRNTDVQIPSLAYWQRVRDICTRHGVLLILDEIPIAFGRTGYMFAFEHYGITPDIVCLGKGLGAGVIPMAGIVARDRFNIAPDVSLGHYTFEKNPLGSAAALAMLDFIEEKGILDKVAGDEAFLLERLSDLQERCPLIGDVRGMGLLWGVELVRDRGTREKAVTEAERIMYACLQAGLSFKVSQGNVIQLSPPLTIAREELGTAFGILENALLT